jgi:intracellular multiplication protein IcmG
MADKDQYNDEYQFADLDAITPDSGEDGELPSGDEPPISGDTHVIDRLETNSVKRNALIVVVLVVFIMIIYKFMGSVFSTSQTPVKATAPTMTAPASKPVVVQPISSQPVSVQAPVAQVSSPGLDTQINQKLSALEVTQQSMRTDVSSVSSQIGGISTNLNTLLAKIAELEGIVSALNTKLDDQSRIIEQLTIKRTAKAAHSAPRKAKQYQKYYIQAVIPGRAWLIATNGSTLTVREGTIIAGYGMVKLIDPNQGRVTTSSGQIIRFSQEDS